MKITKAIPALFAALAALAMKTIITSNWRPLHRSLCTPLLGIAALWAMLGNAQAQLYVAYGNTVGEYDATTGAAINGFFITGVEGLGSPQGLALSGNILYVASIGGWIGEYDATTGAAINAKFITTALDSPSALALSGNILYVTNQGNNTVGAYDATTGAVINAASSRG
jgi:hypothetical protein